MSHHNFNPESHFGIKKARLADRAFMLKASRQFFEERQIMEVDCPILSESAAIDLHIDLISALYQHKFTYYLHSSPEYGMKRLLSQGLGDIYQLSHVFRDGEWSPKHNPEFMMAEWYRIGFSLEKMMNETLNYIRLFLGNLQHRIVHYRSIFLEITGIDYVKASEHDLLEYIRAAQIPYYEGIENEGKDALLNLILGMKIEPLLGNQELCVLAYYPASQAALAKKRIHEDEEVAERFEIYYQGVELANGYHELTDANEQRLRFEEANECRKKFGKHRLPIDEHFLQALEQGLPDCCGVAVGFDRLMMLRHHLQSIEEILALSWREVASEINVDE